MLGKSLLLLLLGVIALCNCVNLHGVYTESSELQSSIAKQIQSVSNEEIVAAFKGPGTGVFVRDSLENLGDVIPGGGIPGIDYPILSFIPETGFTCGGLLPGYYADVAPGADCQVFHICQSDDRIDSFLCPNGTMFNQQYFVCDWWFNVDCANAVSLYSLNALLGQSDLSITGEVISSGQFGDVIAQTSGATSGDSVVPITGTALGAFGSAGEVSSTGSGHGAGADTGADAGVDAGASAGAIAVGAALSTTSSDIGSSSTGGFGASGGTSSSISTGIQLSETTGSGYAGTSSADTSGLVAGTDSVTGVKLPSVAVNGGGSFSATSLSSGYGSSTIQGSKEEQVFTSGIGQTIVTISSEGGYGSSSLAETSGSSLIGSGLDSTGSAVLQTSGAGIVSGLKGSSVTGVSTGGATTSGTGNGYSYPSLTPPTGLYQTPNN